MNNKYIIASFSSTSSYMYPTDNLFLVASAYFCSKEEITSILSPETREINPELISKNISTLNLGLNFNLIIVSSNSEKESFSFNNLNVIKMSYDQFFTKYYMNSFFGSEWEFFKGAIVIFNNRNNTWDNIVKSFKELKIEITSVEPNYPKSIHLLSPVEYKLSLFLLCLHGSVLNQIEIGHSVIKGSRFDGPDDNIFYEDDIHISEEEKADLEKQLLNLDPKGPHRDTGDY